MHGFFGSAGCSSAGPSTAVPEESRPVRAVSSAFQIQFLHQSCSLLVFRSEFGPQIFRHGGKGFGPQKGHKVFVTEKFIQCCHDEDQFGVTNLGFPYHQFLLLALSSISIYQALGAGKFLPPGAIASVTLLAREASLVN